MTTTLTQYNGYDARQVAIIKDQIAKGASDDELAYFLEVCKLTGLNPLMKQIYAVMRYSDGKQRMTIQTGIDGYRLLAARSGQLAGIDDAVYDTETASHPGRATVTVYKKPPHYGERVAFTATARWSEYVQTNKDGKPTTMWAKMPYLMLAKCAEALALRKAFPAELSGLYTADEMAQADSPEPVTRMVGTIDAPAEYTAPAATTTAAPSQQRTAPSADNMGIGEFVTALGKLGISQQDAKTRLGVRSFGDHELPNRRAALEKLAGVIETPAEPEPEEIVFVEEDHSPEAKDADVAQDAPESAQPWAHMSDVAFRKLCNSAGMKAVGQVEDFLSATLGEPPYDREQAIAKVKRAKETKETAERTPDLKTLPAKAVN